MNNGGIYKETSFLGQDDHGEYIHVIGGELKKFAAEVYAPVRDYLASEFVPLPGKTYLHVNAMGASEAYGQNVNGDAFPELELAVSHVTFKTHAHPFYSHANKDPKKALGKVVFSVYNPQMKRVELIVEVDNAKAPDIVEQVNSGEFPRVSMGTKVPFEICSVCGNKNKTIQARCEHLKYKLGTIYPDGRRVSAINTNCTFFDISFVRVPADRSASVISKVASDGTVAEPHEVIFDVGEKNASEGEPLLSSPPIGSLLHVLGAAEPDLPYSTLKNLSEVPLGRVFSSLGALGIILKPREFQTIIIINGGNPSLASKLWKAGLSFSPGADTLDLDPTWSGAPDSGVMESLTGLMSGRSAYRPYMTRRVAVVSNGGSLGARTADKPLLMISLARLLSGLYGGYRQNVLESADQWLEALKGYMSEGKLGDVKKVLDPGATIKKEASAFDTPLKRALWSFPAAYLAAGYYTHKAKEGRPIGRAGEFIATHPLLLGAAGTVGAKGLVTGAKKAGRAAKELYQHAKTASEASPLDSFIMKEGSEAYISRIMTDEEQEAYILSKIAELEVV